MARSLRTWMVWAFVLSSLSVAHASHNFRFVQPFRTIFPLGGVKDYPPEAMMANCGGEFSDARAWLGIWQRNGTTRVRIWVMNAAPRTF